jgi:RNA polymerase sigma factor (TIGR02999 family)
VNAGDVTRILHRLADGDAAAKDELLTLLQDRLHRIARASMAMERRDHTLQPTALLNEFYIELCAAGRIDFTDRNHFFSFAAGSMRRILVAHARTVKAQKRGGGQPHVALDFSQLKDLFRDPDELIWLDNALTKLEARAPRQARVVECKFFLGMEWLEVAKTVGKSEAQVRRDWITARATLLAMLTNRSAVDD